MEKVNSSYIKVECVDIIDMFGLETYDKFKNWFKQDSFGHSHNCGSGNFNYDLERYYEEPFEDEDPNERIYNDNYCPEFLEMMVKTLKAEQNQKYDKNLQLIYVVVDWQ